MNKKAFFGVSDQALQSLLNFFIGLTFINYTTKEVFGMYSIGYATILLVIGFSNAIVNTQMTVRAHKLEKGQFEQYCGYMLLQLLLFSILLSVSLILIGITLHEYDLNDYGLYVSTIGFAIPGYVFFEFSRRYYYLKNLSELVLAMDVLYVFVFLLFAIPCFFYLNYELHYSYFLLSGVLTFFIPLVFLLRSEIIFKLDIKAMYRVVRESWNGGSWASLGIVTTWGQAQGYVLLVSATMGTRALAEINAARLLFAPIMLLSTGIVKVYMPAFSKLYINGSIDKLLLQAKYTLLLVMGLSLFYFVFVYSYIDNILEILFSSEYLGIEHFVIFWAAYYLVLAVRANKSLLMQVFRKFKQITMIGFFVTPLILVFGYILLGLVGLEGILISMIVGEIIFIFMLNREISNVRLASSG